MTEYLLVMTNVSDIKVGKSIAEKIIQERLAACVSVSPPGHSLYWWQNKITEDQEHTLFIKTKKDIYPELEEKIRQIHPYEIPEIIAFPILVGSQDYLDWIDKETQA